jgi:hypothetical protein
MTATYSAVEAALFSILGAAIAEIDDAPALELDEPRLSDPPPDSNENRFRAVLMPMGRSPSDDQLATPPPFHVEARFGVGLHGVGAADAPRRALLAAMTQALAAALEADWSLGGVASFAEATSLDSDTSKEAGHAPENLLDVQIRVEFEAATRLG